LERFIPIIIQISCEVTMHRSMITALLVVLVCSLGIAAEPNTLTDAQKAAGWKLLFDGKTTAGWRGYGQDGFPSKGWVAEDGTLHIQAGAGAGDIMTIDQYGDFDLRLEWKVSERANSGIMYRVSEDEKSPWRTGVEYQIFDDMGYKVGPDNIHSAGAMYGLYAPPKNKPQKPVGEWNESRIVARGNQIEFWLNGVQVVDCDLSSDDWKERRDKSKFKPYKRFGLNKKGHIDLQDHGHDVWFRNIRIRDLTPAADRAPVALFNGENMDGWSHFLNNGGAMDDVWRVEEGIIICKGQPAGYICTEKEYKNFILRLQWRFNPETKKEGNSGVLLRKTGEDKIWPRCLEAQLMSRNAGDFWIIDNFPVTTVAERTNGRNAKKTHCNENAPGEWNEYEIVVNKGDVTLIVNGEVLNTATVAEEIAGKICLQSEGVEIQFRRISLVPLDN